MAEAAEKISAKESWNVYQLVAAVQADLSKKGIGKEQTNTFDKYKFRGIDDVYNALGPVLSRHGLVVFPEVRGREVTQRDTQKGGTVFHVTLDVVYHFVSAHDGSEMLVPVPGEAMDRGDKAINKAMSAAYKLACFQTFCIPIEGQDSEMETHEIKKSNSVAAALREGSPDVDQGHVRRILNDLDNSFIYDEETRVLEPAAPLDDIKALYDEIVSDEALMAHVWAKLSPDGGFAKTGSKIRRYLKDQEKRGWISE